MTLNTAKVTRTVKTRQAKHRGGRGVLSSASGGKNYLPCRQHPNPPDVVSGRGSAARYHTGNKRYWALILGSRATYAERTREEKIEIAQSIMAAITTSNGRFLQKEAKTRSWFVMPKSLVIFKITQALSQREVPKYMRGASVKKNGIVEAQPRRGAEPHAFHLEIQQIATQIQDFRLR